MSDAAARDAAAQPARRWLIWQIADSAFPTGGFAHSGGLEASLQHGAARTPAGLDAFVCDYLHNVGNASLPFVAAAFDDPDATPALDTWLDAMLTSHVANRASRTQGRTFLATCARVFDEGPAATSALLDALAARARSREASAHLAPMFGAALAALGAARTDVLALYLHLALRGVVSAAVRLGVVGPLEAQRLQRRHGPTLDAVLTTCAHLRPEHAVIVAPLLEVMGATHDRLYARLFQT